MTAETDFRDFQRREHSMNRISIAACVLGIFFGVLISPFSPLSSQAQTAPGERWALDVWEGGQISIAWRLNTVTGALEHCAVSAGGAQCTRMPPPAP